jgi:hypothetical protein
MKNTSVLICMFISMMAGTSQSSADEVQVTCSSPFTSKIPEQFLFKSASPNLFSSQVTAKMEVTLYYRDFNQPTHKIGHFSAPVPIANGTVMMKGGYCTGTFDGTPLCIGISGAILADTAGHGTDTTRFITFLGVSTNPTECEDRGDVVTFSITGVSFTVDKAPDTYAYMDTKLKRFSNFGDDKDPRTRFAVGVTYKVSP